MSTFRLEIVTPEGRAFEGDIYAVSLQGSEGSMSIMKDHVPMVTAVAAGPIRLYLEPGKVDLTAKTSGGVLSVTHELVSLLTADFQIIEE